MLHHLEDRLFFVRCLKPGVDDFLDVLKSRQRGKVHWGSTALILDFLHFLVFYIVGVLQSLFFSMADLPFSLHSDPPPLSDDFVSKEGAFDEIP